MKNLVPLLVLVCAAGAAPAPGQEPDEGAVPRESRRSEPDAPAAADHGSDYWKPALHWRCIGPANMGGRITAIAVSPKDPSLFWVATASGGLLRTTNNGVTFEHQFDHEATVSIGDVAVAPSDPDVVWVGTGEANPRNSVSFGDGVYKSTDGGKTWKNMGLRKSFQIGRIAIHPTNPDVVYVGALGRLWGPNEDRGLYKSIDGGRTWTKILHVDDKTGVVDVRMNDADPETLLVATYERARDGLDSNDPAKKWGPGSALWRTTDGGKTFRKVTKGLPTCMMGRIGIDLVPKDPSVAYVIVESERIGREPEGFPYAGVSGEDADAGARLTQVAESGPAANAGLRAGDIVLKVGPTSVHSYEAFVRELRKRQAGDKVPVEVSRDRQSVVVELALTKRPAPARRGRGAEENESADPARPEEAAPRGGGRGGDPNAAANQNVFSAALGGQRENLQDQQGPEGYCSGGLYRSSDGGETWTRINSLNPRPMYFSQVRVDPSDENHMWVLGVTLYRSKDRGCTFTADGGRQAHSDHHAMWIDPRDGRHALLGNDGGLYQTYDRGETWDHLNHAAIGQFYHVAAGSGRNYRVYGGLQDNGSWGGPSRVSHGPGPTNDDWFRIGGGDGFVCRVDQEDPDQVYFESQGGGTGRRNLRTAEQGAIRPRAQRGTTHRFNWNTPFILSAHNSRIFYVAGERVFRSLDRGRDLRPVSPEITNTDKGSATALAESPLDADVLYVGTDDGALRMTRDGGREWVDLWKGGAAVSARGGRSARGADGDGRAGEGARPETDGAAAARTEDDARAETRAGGEAPTDADPRRRTGSRNESRAVPRAPLTALLPGPRWVSSIEASRSAAGRVYATFDGHRSDDDAPYVAVSEDYGRTWTSLRANLPERCGSTKVVHEDRRRPDILWLGTEFGAWVSLDRGQSWISLHGSLPTVAVHDFAFPEACDEVVAATHGRSLWILDATILRQATPETLGAAAHLYEPAAVVLWRPEPARGGGTRRFVGENPAADARIAYSLSARAGEISLRVTTPAGETVRELVADPSPGLHVVTWDLRRPPRGGASGAAGPGREERGRGEGRPEGAGQGGGGGFGRRGGQRVKPGIYNVLLSVDGRILTRTLAITVDPEHPEGAWLESPDRGGENDAGDEDDDPGRDQDRDPDEEGR